MLLRSLLGIEVETTLTTPLLLIAIVTD